jgi:hypothetical protein
MGKLEKGMPVELRIGHQGAMVINDAFIVGAGDNVLAVEVDMNSKYGCLGSFGSDNGGPMVYVCATEETIGIHGDRDEPTRVSFPGLKGWGVFAARLSKYTISICFTKNN